VSAAGEVAVMQNSEAKEVMQTALGRQTADLVVVNARVANVYTGEILDDYSVAVKGKWIAYVGREPRENIGAKTVVIDAAGMTVIPGFIESHTHLVQIYGSAEFLRYAIKGGTTTIITETMEVFPIGGCEAVVDFLESFRDQPVKVYGTMPAMGSISSAASGISVEDIQKLLLRDDILGLGETYWQLLLQNPDQFLLIFAETLRRGKTLEGHSAGAGGRKLMAYAAAGISSCHEPITAEEVQERLRLGIYVMVREGSIRRELETVARIKEMNVDLRRLILVTDSVEPNDLIEKGYMEYVVQKAIDVGFKPMDALRMATLNAAEHFSLDQILGGIAPGKYADMAIIPDMQTIRPEYVIANGKIVARQGEVLVAPREHVYAEASRHSVHLPAEFQPDDFSIRAEEAAASVNVRVMDLITELVTKELKMDMLVSDGLIQADPGRDIIKVAAIDRACNPGRNVANVKRLFVGLIRGLKMRAGAFATSTAWDTADIVVVGAGDADMALAVNRIRALQGGMAVCKDGEVLAEFALPLWGLVSDQPMEILAKKLAEIDAAVSSLGVRLAKPFLTLGTLTTASIPYLRICEEGLVNLREGKTVGL